MPWVDEVGWVEDTPPAPASYADQVALAQSWGVPADQIASVVGTPQSVAANNQAQAQAITEQTGSAPAWSQDVGYTAPPPTWLNPADYTANNYAAPYTQQQITSQVDPSWIRQMNGQTYASVKGPSDLSGGEYLVDPKTGKFQLDANGNPIGVTYPKPNGFSDWVTTPAGGLTMMALLAAGGMGINALAGAGAGGAFTPAAGSGASFTIAPGAAYTAGAGAGGISQALPYTEAFDALNLTNQGINASQVADILTTSNPALDPFIAQDIATMAANGYSEAAINQALQYSYTAQELAPLGLESLASTLPATSLLPSLSSLSSLVSPLSKLLSSTGALSSALGGGGSKSGTNLAGLFGQYGTGSGGTGTATATNTPSPVGTFVHGTQIASPLTNLSVPTETYAPEYVNPNALSEIKAAADGGIMHLAEGSQPEELSMKPVQMRGKQTQHGRLFGFEGIPLYTVPGKAEGGSIPEGFQPQFFSEGGLKNSYVRGAGTGTSDSIPAMLSNGEFVIPADVVSSLGDGSNDAGAKMLDSFLSTIRSHKQRHDAKHIPKKSKGPLGYLLEAKRKVKK